MNAHFFDLDTILELDSKIWIVDKTKPSIPIIKISPSEFQLIRSGIYKSEGNSIKFSGHTYWVKTDLLNKIKIKSKKDVVDISNLAFSMREFLDEEIIERGEFKIHKDNFSHIMNSNDDVYIICSKNNKRNYEKIISKIEKDLEGLGILVKNYYFISETFYERDNDDISFKKARLLLQHLIGLKTDDNKFTDEEIQKYNKISFYDDDSSTINFCKNINDLLRQLVTKSDNTVSEKIKEIIKTDEPILELNEVTFNKVNKFVKTEVKLEFYNVIKTFESFKLRF